MRNLHRRQKDLLRNLLEFDDFQPVKTFARLLGCSDKTIRNDLAFLQAQGIPIDKTSGKGIRVAVTDKHRISEILDGEQVGGLSTEQRRMKILFDLLDGQRSRLSIQTLSDTYFVSKTSIVNDLRVIENKLSVYRLSLQKDVQGTKLLGEESDIRRALVDMLNHMVMSKINPLDDHLSRLDQETLGELEERFGGSNVRYAESLLGRIEDELRYKIADPYYINLITHILILIVRVKQDKTLLNAEGKVDYDNPRFYTAAKRLAEDIETKFQVALNEAEVSYLYRYLTSSGGISVQDNAEPYGDTSLCAIAEEIVQSFTRIFPMTLSFSRPLYRAMLLHLRPMMNRVQYGIHIRNPLREKIETEFPEVMEPLKSVMRDVAQKHRLGAINDDEIAYLAVYFQSAIEESINRKSVVIVCSSGIGTSHLLEKRIKKYFPEWNIVDVVSVKRLKEVLTAEQVDLVVATVNIQMELPIPVAYVSVLFGKEDERRIRDSLVKKLDGAKLGV